MSDWLAGTTFEAIEGAFWGGLLSGALLPLLGMWVVLQRIVFLGVTLAQIAAAGVALGLVLDLPPLALGLGLTLAVVLGSALLGRGRVATLGDASLGAAFCGASALSLLFVSRSPADLDEVQHVLHGNLIWASLDAVGLVAAVLALGVAVLGLFFKELVFVAFDAETAAALGVRTRGWLLLLFSVLAVALGVSMRTTGSLLTFAMLVLPPMAALQLGRGLRTSFALAALLGAAGTLAGLTLAVTADLHVESSITVCLFVLLPAAAAWRRQPVGGLAVLLAALAAGWGLARTAAPPLSSLEHHHPEERAGAEPFHVDVLLSARRGPQGLVVSWDLHAERAPGAEAPAELWIVLTSSEGLFHEHVLVDEEHPLGEGRTQQTGSCLVPFPDAVHRVEGQLWTGPPSALDAEPLALDLGDVVGADVLP